MYISSTTSHIFDPEALNSRSSTECRVTNIADFKSAYISLIIDPRDLQSETNLQEILCYKSSNVVRFDLRPLLQGQTRIGKLESVDNSLIIVWDGKPTYRKSWARNLLVLWDLTLGPYFKVK